MPAEDRDRQFENALARHLRAGAGAGDSACLDAELLAAYHERMLSPEEMNIAKEHLVSCARCQEILAQLEATDTVQALQKDDG
jgi:putative zinc finger protein